VTLFRRMGRRAAQAPPPASPRPDMPPRPQRPRPPAESPLADLGYMTGGVRPEYDPCGAGPIENGEPT